MKTHLRNVLLQNSIPTLNELKCFDRGDKLWILETQQQLEQSRMDLIIGTFERTKHLGCSFNYFVHNLPSVSETTFERCLVSSIEANQPVILCKCDRMGNKFVVWKLFKFHMNPLWLSVVFVVVNIWFALDIDGTLLIYISLKWNSFGF